MSDEFLNEEENNLSALKDSIKKKGSNSYYYAHDSDRIDSLAPKEWNGLEEPLLLASNTTTTSSKPLSIVTLEYSYADDNKNVKLYIDFPDAENLKKEQIKLECVGTI